MLSVNCEPFLQLCLVCKFVVKSCIHGLFVLFHAVAKEESSCHVRFSSSAEPFAPSSFKWFVSDPCRIHHGFFYLDPCSNSFCVICLSSNFQFQLPDLLQLRSSNELYTEHSWNVLWNVSVVMVFLFDGQKHHLDSRIL